MSLFTDHRASCRHIGDNDSPSTNLCVVAYKNIATNHCIAANEYIVTDSGYTAFPVLADGRSLEYRTISSNLNRRIDNHAETMIQTESSFYIVRTAQLAAAQRRQHPLHDGCRKPTILCAHIKHISEFLEEYKQEPQATYPPPNLGLATT